MEGVQEQHVEKSKSDLLRELDIASHLKAATVDYPKIDKAEQAAVHGRDVNGQSATDIAEGGRVNMDTMLSKFKGLALSKEIHSVIIEDPIICPFLVLLMGSETESHVLRSLEVLHLLALNPENCPKLGKVLHFHDGLNAVCGNTKLPKEIRDFAQLINDIVKSRCRPVLKARTTVHPNQLNTTKAENVIDRKRNQSVSKGKCVELYVPHCIFKDKRLRMTESLLTLNGIISITYDMKKCYCLVRTKVHVQNELLGKTIANLGFECHLIMKTDNNDDVMVKMEPDPKFENSLSMNDQENLGAGGRKSPQYLSDSDSETSFQEPQAVATVGGDNGGQKEKKGWFSSAAGFIQKSFYW